MLLAWAIILFLILVNALYVAAEFATVSVRRSRIAQLAEEGNKLAKQLLPTVQDAAALDRYIAACQIGITWSSLVVGAYGQATLAVWYGRMLENWAGLDAATAFSVTSISVLLLLTGMQVVMGELVPKSAALQFPSQTALATVVPMRISLAIYSWFLTILNGSGLAILKLFGVSHATHQHVHSPEEIEFFIGESSRGGLLELDEHQRLRRALKLAARPVRQLMVPRRMIAGIDIDATTEQVAKALAENAYTRLPVYKGTSDNIVGVVHTKDLVTELSRSGSLPPVRSLMRPLVTVAESATAGQLLDILRQGRTHQALVVGEVGVRGLVTFGDLLAELLGGITGKGRLGQPPPERLPDGRVRLPGLMRAEEAAEWIGIQWNVNAVTVGGLLLHSVGHVPMGGEKVTVQGVEFEVEQVVNQAIASVLARPVEPQEEVNL